MEVTGGMELTGEDYRISYDPNTTTITCEGKLWLYGAEGFLSISSFEKSRFLGQPVQRPPGKHDGYDSILALLEEIIEQHPATIILNLQKLETLNSSGINAFSKFVLKVRDDKQIRLIIQGNRQFLWQNKVLNNYQKLLPTLQIVWG